MLKEVVTHIPYTYKKWTTERGKAWNNISENLNKLNKGFNVEQRGVRERYEKLKFDFKKKIRAEESASGIAPDTLTPVEQLL